PPGMVRTIAVLPPDNRTGDELLVSGSSVLERYVLATSRVTVADVLAAEAGIQLERRGFTVVPADAVAAPTGGGVPRDVRAASGIAERGKLPGLALYLEILRWDPDAPTEPSYIVVGARATLVDPASGRVVWEYAPPTDPVATPGEVNLGAA